MRRALLALSVVGALLAAARLMWPRSSVGDRGTF